MLKQKILIFDIETSATVGHSWKIWETNVHHVEREWEILSASYKWFGDKDIKFIRQANYQKSNDKKLVQKLWKLFDEADIILAHNGKSFDIKKVNARIAVHNLPPPSPFKILDTKLEARKYFGFNSNSLDALAKYFKVGSKLKHPGYDMWLGCMKNDAQSWKDMERYNRHDVFLLEGVYKHIRPWMKTHPNVNDFDKPDNCPVCGGEHLKSCGIIRTERSVFRKYRCMDCKAYSKAAKKEPNKKRNIVNLSDK